MSSGSAVLAEGAKQAPSAPGVYCVLGPDDDLLYIGKAADLRKRLSGWARGTTDPDDVRVHRLVGAVHDVRWFECTDERDALCREADLIVALAPPYNASMRFDAYTYVYVEDTFDGGGDRLSLRITEDPRGAEHGRGGRVYGAFPHLGKGKSSWRAVRTNGGYSALVRLLWVAFAQPRVRYRLPAKLRGTSPPLAQELRVARADTGRLRRELHDFLSGRSDRLLRALSAATTSDELPVFMRGPLTDDLQAADGFFRLGPRSLRALRQRHRLSSGPVPPETFAASLESELRGAIGDFRAPSRPPQRAVRRRMIP